MPNAGLDSQSVSLFEKASLTRDKILDLSHRAKSAHVGSALSVVEVLVSVFHLRNREQPAIRRFVMSKGHAAMALYSAAFAFGELDEKHLNEYFQNGSRLWGHPAKSEEFPFIQWSTGSLGHGLGVIVGFGYTSEKLMSSQSGLNVCLMSDGECDEGSVWEAALFASHHKLRSVCAIIDYNKIQSFGRIDEVLNLEPFKDKWISFGWSVIEVDGHDSDAILAALNTSALSKEKPTCIIAHTVKGKGVTEIEDTVQSHYKPITVEQLQKYSSQGSSK